MTCFQASDEIIYHHGLPVWVETIWTSLAFIECRHGFVQIDSYASFCAYFK